MSDHIVIGNVNSKRHATSRVGQDLQRSEVRFGKSILFKSFGPRKQINKLLGIINKILSLLRGFLINYRHKPFKFSPHLERVLISLNKPDVGLNGRPFVQNPMLLRFNMQVNISSLEVPDIVFNHQFLDLVGCVFLGLVKILNDSVYHRTKVSIRQSDFCVFELMLRFFWFCRRHKHFEMVLR